MSPKTKNSPPWLDQYGSKIFCQMYHPGRQSSKPVNGGVMPVAPSGTKDPMCFEFTRAMTQEEIHQLVQDFGVAAARCKESGFDGIELHCAHGYLLAEFLSPYVNKRTDQYGEYSKTGFGSSTKSTPACARPLARTFL